MRKREQQKHNYYPDIFEPAPLWRGPIQNNSSSVNTYAHSSTYRSPIHHQPSLNDLLYDFNRPQEGHYNPSQSSNNSSGYFYEYPQENHSVVQYDDDDDEEPIRHRQQEDNISATSLFTAVDHFDPQEEEEDDASSIENLRHGYQPLSPDHILMDFKQKLNLTHTLDWEDYKPHYRQLNESYAHVKKDVYNEIYSTLQKMQAVDTQFNRMKMEFQVDLQKNYQHMSDNLISQCQALSKEREEYNLKSKTSEKIIQFESEKIRLNIGGNLFETTLSTLRRDTNSLLATMFSGRHPIRAESDGSYFIDRDPSHFRHILNYLRDLRIPPAILQDTKIRQELLQEAKYYCIEGLVHTLEQV